jgi:hypothetical protein
LSSAWLYTLLWSGAISALLADASQFSILQSNAWLLHTVTHRALARTMSESPYSFSRFSRLFHLLAGAYNHALSFDRSVFQGDHHHKLPMSLLCAAITHETCHSRMKQVDGRLDTPAACFHHGRGKERGVYRLISATGCFT